ncbi:TerC family protein [Salinivibrio sp. YCSC6]|uniref:TerC family protein n=1 Tax=Salinivibrio sp. YCSC6 TaxID=2003370 RepID=UPI000BBB76A8|nr:TerC family protein [Salinivibrio sp. YCSC6]PCE67104.1 hypothetical protein B6G00_01630 [Salinivibrio sp. YCSC6]QCF35998.1 TerC family protein [Salinivibrio sp. YCSC6]
MLTLFMEPQTWVVFFTLLTLEVVLGVDNLVFISVLCERLPKEKRRFARTLGIGLAVMSRIGLLLSIAWVMSLTAPLFTIGTEPVTGKDLIMLFGGGFLLLKSAKELWAWLGHGEPVSHSTQVRTGMAVILLQIVAVDAVFSMDSVITAVGLTQDVPVMVAAIITAAIIMMIAAEPVNNLVSRYPGFKTLALLFLVLLGLLLMAEGAGIHINKGYVYVAMAFGLILELCHIRLRNKQRLNIKRIRPHFSLKVSRRIADSR